MRVAFVCADPGIPVFGSKGASVHVQEVIRSLLRRGDRVTLFTPRAGGEPDVALESLELCLLPQPIGDSPEARERAALDLDRHLADRIALEGPFDLVYQRYSLWSSAGMRAARAAGIPGVLEVNSPLIDEQDRYRSLSDRPAAVTVAETAFEAASHIVAVSRPVASWVEQFPQAAGKVTVVPNGVDPSRFPRRAAARQGVDFTVGFVGTLKPWHGLDILVDAFARLARSDPCYRLLIAGDGPMRPEIEADLVARGLSDRVEFTGAVDSADVPSLMERMDVGVAPYPDLPDFYFSPLKLFEYMAAGLPVVATDIGQISEVIKSGRTGILYRPGDPHGLAAAISGLRSNPDLCQELGRAGRKTVESHTWDRVVSNILDLVGERGAGEISQPRVGPGAAERLLGAARIGLIGLARRVPVTRVRVRDTFARLRGSGSVFRPHLKGQWKLAVGGVGAMLAETAFRLLEPWPIKFILDRVIQPDADQTATGIGWADRIDPMTLLLVSALAVVIFTGLRALSAYLSTVSFALAGNRILTEVRADLYRHLQRLSVSFHTKARGGDLITRVTGDVGRLQEVAVTAALPLGVNFLTFAGMLVVMLWMDWKLTLMALAAVPLFAVTMVRLTGRIRTVARKQRKIEGELASVAAESLSAITVVQAYSLEEPFEATFGSENQRSLRDGVQAKRLAAALERKTDIFVAVGTGLVLYFGSRLVIAGGMTPGDLIVFVTYLKSAFKPMRDIAKYTGRLAKAAASAERIAELLRTIPDVRDRPGARPAPAFQGEIRFEDVDLAYDLDREVISDLTLTIPARAKVALVGSSGAGKSSLVGLLLRLYEPVRGRITIDGHDLADLTLESVRRQIAVVLQDSVLFRASIRDNIAFGDPAASPEAIEQAARLANAHDFIVDLPSGYDTVIGERGATVSGGERQRIAIARAALRDAPIVILDEPTTGLDGSSRATVLEALGRLMEGRTVVHITHDLEAVTAADVIFYLEGGRISETGTHSELVNRGGSYAKAFSVQGSAGLHVHRS